MQSNNILAKHKSLIYAFLLIAFAVFAYFRTIRETEFGDFHVFWFAGRTLLNGGDLYEVVNGYRAFIYPPFAAIIFIPLAILPFKVACYIFFFVNLICFILTAKLVPRILALRIKDQKIVKLASWFSYFLVFKLSWNNLMMIQVNQLVYLFIILGVLNFLEKKENLSIFYFCIAISIKVFPILFAFWVVIRGSKTAILKFIVGAFVCIILPMLIQGPDRGIKQLSSFYNDFILNNVKGSELGFSYASQSLPSLLHRTLTASTNSNEPSYNIVELGKENTLKIIKISQIVIFLSMCAVLIFLALKKENLHLFEPAIVILTIHLISSCTWKAHMVGMILVFAVVGSNIIKRHFARKLNFLEYLLIAYVVIVSLLGQVFIGKNLQVFFGAYGDYTFEMLFCLIYIYTIMLRERHMGLKELT